MAVNWEFEWDSAKAASNLAKHGISFEAATRIFADSTFVDVDASHPGATEIHRKAIGVIDGRSNAKETRLYDESTLHPRSE